MIFMFLTTFKLSLQNIVFPFPNNTAYTVEQTPSSHSRACGQHSLYDYADGPLFQKHLFYSLILVIFFFIVLQSLAPVLAWIHCYIVVIIYREKSDNDYSSPGKHTMLPVLHILDLYQVAYTSSRAYCKFDLKRVGLYFPYIHCRGGYTILSYVDFSIYQQTIFKKKPWFEMNKLSVFHQFYPC